MTSAGARLLKAAQEMRFMAAMDRAGPSRRLHDMNGWFEVKGNPLSKVGVFEYSGAQIGAPAADAHKIFKVYRPAEELARADTIDSFKLVPFIDDHTMLGEGFTSTDDRPVAGVVGEDVYFEGDTLYGNPKVFSKALAEKIKKGKTELSCGYRCRYEFTSGEYNGERYDVIQRDIRGNHLALVDEGRMGREVAILDQLTFTVDAKEISPVEEKLAEILEALAALSARMDALEAAKPAVADEEEPKKAADEGDDPEKTGDEEEEETAADEEDPARVEAKAEEVAELADDLAEIAEEISAASGMDAKLKAKVSKAANRAKALKGKVAMDGKALAKLRGQMAALAGKPAMDERRMVDTLATRTALVEKLSRHVGTFDHSRMTTPEIAEYGIKKLGIQGVAKGMETVALDAYLQAKPAPTPAAAHATDAASGSLAKRINSHVTGA